MQTLEEDLQYVLDLLHKLAFASLTPANANQLRDATQCVTDIRDASSLAQEIIWILEDVPEVQSFNVELSSGTAKLQDLILDPPLIDADAIASTIQQRLSHVLHLCAQPERVEGSKLKADRDAVGDHLDAPKFDAAAVLAIVAPEWSCQLIERIDQATSHNAMLHQSRQGLRQRQ